MTAPASISPAEFLSAAPASVSGNTPWASRYAAELRRIWLAHAAQDARTVQTHLGPSELGVECDRQVVWKLLGLPATNHVVDPWPSIRGRALHTMAEDVFSADNLRSGLLRWITEQKVTPTPEHPGTADLYDAVEESVVDHKFLGASTMTKIRKQPPRKYVGQLFLYGLGYSLLGLPVRRIAIAAYPATAGSLDGLYVWEHTFAEADPITGELVITPDVSKLLLDIFTDTDRRKRQAADVRARRLDLDGVPAEPDNDECFFCPAYRPQSAKDGGPGCPGTAKSSGTSGGPTDPGTGP